MSVYKCSKCDYSTKIKGNIKIHLKSLKCMGASSIEQINMISCDICNKEFENETYLKSHKKICVEKKTCTIITYADSDEINKEILELKNLIKSLYETIVETRNELKDLTKRLEKYEKVKAKEDSDKKKGYEEVDGSNNACSVINRKFETFRSMELLDDKLSKIKTFEKSRDGYWLPKVYYKEKTYIGKALYDFIRIEVNGKDVELTYENAPIIMKEKVCREDGTYRVIKTGECYCMKHFDEETGKPLVPG